MPTSDSNRRRARRKPIGWCMSIRGDGRRCGAPATRTYATDWHSCDACFGNGRFDAAVSLLTEKEQGE